MRFTDILRCCGKVIGSVLLLGAFVGCEKRIKSQQKEKKSETSKSVIDKGVTDKVVHTPIKKTSSENELKEGLNVLIKKGEDEDKIIIKSKNNLENVIAIVECEKVNNVSFCKGKDVVKAEAKVVSNEEEVRELLIRNIAYDGIYRHRTLPGSKYDIHGMILKSGKWAGKLKGPAAFLFFKSGDLLYSVITKTEAKLISEEVAVEAIKAMMEHPDKACTGLAQKYYDECLEKYNENRKIIEKVKSIDKLDYATACKYLDNAEFINIYMVEANKLGSGVAKRGKDVDLLNNLKTKLTDILKKQTKLSHLDKGIKLRILKEEASKGLEEDPLYKQFKQNVEEKKKRFEERRKKINALLEKDIRLINWRNPSDIKGGIISVDKFKQGYFYGSLKILNSNLRFADEIFNVKKDIEIKINNGVEEEGLLVNVTRELMDITSEGAKEKDKVVLKSKNNLENVIIVIDGKCDKEIEYSYREKGKEAVSAKTKVVTNVNEIRKLLTRYRAYNGVCVNKDNDVYAKLFEQGKKIKDFKSYKFEGDAIDYIYTILTRIKRTKKPAEKEEIYKGLKSILKNPDQACMSIAQKFYSECLKRYNENRKIAKKVNRFADLDDKTACKYLDNDRFIQTFLKITNDLGSGITKSKNDLSKDYNRGSINILTRITSIVFEVEDRLKRYDSYWLFSQAVEKNRKKLEEHENNIDDLVIQEGGLVVLRNPPNVVENEFNVDKINRSYFLARIFNGKSRSIDEESFISDEMKNKAEELFLKGKTVVKDKRKKIDEIISKMSFRDLKRRYNTKLFLNHFNELRVEAEKYFQKVLKIDRNYQSKINKVYFDGGEYVIYNNKCKKIKDFSTPENALRSFFYAIQMRDKKTLSQIFKKQKFSKKSLEDIDYTYVTDCIERYMDYLKDDMKIVILKSRLYKRFVVNVNNKKDFYFSENAKITEDEIEDRVGRYFELEFWKKNRKNYLTVKDLSRMKKDMKKYAQAQIKKAKINKGFKDFSQICYFVEGVDKRGVKKKKIRIIEGYKSGKEFFCVPR